MKWTQNDEILEANQNWNNCLVSNFLDKLKFPALFSHLFRTEKRAGKFNLSKKLLTRQLFLFWFASSIRYWAISCAFNLPKIFFSKNKKVIEKWPNKPSASLDANQNKNNCLVCNFSDKLKFPALFSVRNRWEKRAGNFNLSKKLLTRQLFLFWFTSKCHTLSN